MKADYTSKDGRIKLYNMDCMDYLATCKENEFDLAVVDPPYGIEKGFQANSGIAKYGQMETVNDAKPDSEYFNQLMEKAENQIIWGYNHLSDMLPSTKEFLFWWKHQPVVSYSNGELAWTSFTKTAKCIDMPFFGATGADKQRIHPIQKPVKLYDWIYKNYAEQGQRILDTHLGSGSSAIAAHYAGLEFVGIELDEDYFKASVDRFEKETAQGDLFGKGAA